jgi:hypothetical protein
LLFATFCLCCVLLYTLLKRFPGFCPQLLDASQLLIRSVVIYISMQIFLYSLDSPFRPGPFLEHDAVTPFDDAFSQTAVIPACAAQFVRIRGEILQLEAMVELEARLPRQANLQHRTAVSNCEHIANTHVALVHVLEDEVLAKCTGREPGRC